MKFKKEIKKIGDSLWVLIPNEVVKELDLQEHSEVIVNIEKHIEVKTALIQCKKCDYIFHTNLTDNVIDCVNCDNELAQDEFKIIEEDNIE